MAVVKWAVRPWDDRRILYIDELCDVSSMLPNEGDIISRPFLVDPETLEPVGFVSAYRREPACADDACAPPSRRTARIVLWVAVVLVGLLAAFPYYMKWFV